MNFTKQCARTLWHELTRWVVLLAVPLVAYGQSGSQAQHAIAGIEDRLAKPTLVPLVNGVQIHVDCSNPAAKVKTIAAGLQLLGNLHPAVLLISGTCHENVVIQGLDSITLQGNPTATIDGGSDPNVGTVEIVGSLNIALNNLTVTGGGEGVGCSGQSHCLLTQVTIQNSVGAGVVVGEGARLDCTDGVVQNNTNSGVQVNFGSAAFFGGFITGNGLHGVVVRNGGYFAAVPGNLTPMTTIQNNVGDGIQTNLHNTILLNSAVVTGNGGRGVTLQIGSAMSMNSAVITGNTLDGVTLQTGSELNLFASTITNNGGHQIRIGDLSIARFAGFQSNTISGAYPPDVVCDPQFSATRQLVGGTTGATTNCPAELPPTP